MRSRSHAAAVVVLAMLLVGLGVGCDNSGSVQSAVTSVSADGILNPALNGDWVRQEKTLAGQPATLYSTSLEGGADSHIDSICVFLPDAFVNIQVWAPVDPLLVLEALSPVE